MVELCGYWVEYDIDKFYDDTTIMTITSSVKNPRLSLDSGKHWSSLKFGYSKYKIEDRQIQSAQEYNKQLFYNSAVQVEVITKTIFYHYFNVSYLDLLDFKITVEHTLWLY